MVEEAYVSSEGATDWSSYVAGFRVKGVSDWGISFHRQDVNNMYVFRFENESDWVLEKIVGATITNISSGTTTPLTPVYDDVWYMVRVQVIWTGSTNEIAVFIDGESITTASDSDIQDGSVGILHPVGGEITIDTLEVIPLPAPSDYIDINS